MTLLPRSLFDTDSLPGSERYDAWRDSISVVFDYQLRDTVPVDHFHAAIDNTLFDPFVLTSFQAEAAIYERDAARIACDGLDMIMLQFATQGPCHIRGTADAYDCQVGDVIIMDTAQPISTWHDKQHNLTLSFPRQVLENLVPGLERAHLAVLKAN